jgi:hypothetical protein
LVFGPQLFGAYAAIGSLLWSLCFYFWYFLASMHLWRDKWVEGFDNNITPALTALGTCSSIATIPANLGNNKDANTSTY